MILTAFCDSDQCRNYSHKIKPIEKLNVSKGQTYCPDCGRVLIWGKNKKRHRHFAVEKPYKPEGVRIFQYE